MKAKKKIKDHEEQWSKIKDFIRLVTKSNINWMMSHL